MGDSKTSCKQPQQDLISMLGPQGEQIVKHLEAQLATAQEEFARTGEITHPVADLFDEQLEPLRGDDAREMIDIMARDLRRARRG